MSTTRPTVKLSATIAVMAFEIAAAPISAALMAAEERSAKILDRLKMAASAERTAPNAASKARAAATIVSITAEYDAVSDVIFGLQTKLFDLEASIPGLPAVEAMVAA